MDPAEWISNLEPIEQTYAQQCFKFWTGFTGEEEPKIPEGISRANADILKYNILRLIHNFIESRSDSSTVKGVAFPRLAAINVSREGGIMEATEDKRMKFEILSPDNGNGDLEEPVEILERPMDEIVAEFLDLTERERWKKRRSPPKKQQIIPEKKVEESVIESLKEEMPKRILNEPPKNPERIFRKPRRSRPLGLPDWSPVEKGYMRQCFKFWNGFSGNQEPRIPEGISKAKADILKYKMKAKSEDGKRRKRMEELKSTSFRASHEFLDKLALDAAEVGVSISIFVRTCILLASPVVVENPRIVNFFTEAVISK